MVGYKKTQKSLRFFTFCSIYFRVEYTDCLGRTRKCLKKDLSSFLRRDQDLSKVVEARNHEQAEMLQENQSNQQREEKNESPEDNSEEIEKILHIPQPDDIGERFIQQRKQWEEQEVENMQKEFVHYQDVLFDGKYKEKKNVFIIIIIYHLKIIKVRSFNHKININLVFVCVRTIACTSDVQFINKSRVS